MEDISCCLFPRGAAFRSRRQTAASSSLVVLSGSNVRASFWLVRTSKCAASVTAKLLQAQNLRIEVVVFRDSQPDASTVSAVNLQKSFYKQCLQPGTVVVAGMGMSTQLAMKDRCTGKLEKGRRRFPLACLAPLAWRSHRTRTACCPVSGLMTRTCWL